MSENTRDDDCAPGTGIDCGAVLEGLQQYLDGELTADDIDLLSGHLSACYPCADRRDFEQQLRAVVRDCCARDSAPSDLLDRVRASLRSA